LTSSDARPLSPELMAPASEFSMIAAAALGGADAVYCGVSSLNMRRGARNFDPAQLPEVVGRCHEQGMRCYLTLNTIIFDEEMDKVRAVLDRALSAGVDAIIAWDMGVVEEARKRGARVHLSTQASVSNVPTARFWKERGVSRIILARELSLEQVARIRKEVDVEVECFVHGAMCVALSGRCLLSHYTTGRSGNRGQCVQPCRREYEIRDTETGDRYIVGNSYVLSPRDLCAISFVDLLMATGADAFKIEGRNRPPEYVRVVVECYRKAIDAVRSGEFDQSLIDELEARMQRVYHRGFSSGFYRGLPAGAGWSGSSGTAATHRKVYVGRVVNYYRRIGVAEISLDNRSLLRGEEITVIGPTTGVLFGRADEMQVDHRVVERGDKGTRVAVRTREVWRRGDKIFVFEPRFAGSEN